MSLPSPLGNPFDSELEMSFVAAESSLLMISSTASFSYWFCPFTHPDLCVRAKLFLPTSQREFHTL